MTILYTIRERMMLRKKGVLEANKEITILANTMGMREGRQERQEEGGYQIRGS